MGNFGLRFKPNRCYSEDSLKLTKCIVIVTQEDFVIILGLKFFYGTQTPEKWAENLAPFCSG